MAWKLDNVDFVNYGLYVTQAEGVLDIPSIQDSTHSWLDSNYSIATRDTMLPVNDRIISLTCIVRTSTYYAFKTRCQEFMTAVSSPNKRLLTHPYSSTPIECYVVDEVNIERLVNWDSEIQTGRFIIRFVVPGDKKYKYAPLYNGTTNQVKTMLKMGSGAEIESALMGINEIRFSTESNVLLNVAKNDYIIYKNEKFVHFEDIKFVKYSTNKYVYNFKFEHETFKLRNILIKDINNYTEFYYYAMSITDIVTLIVNNAEVRYPGLFVVGDITVDVTKNYHIKSETALDLLKRMCDEENIEFMFVKEASHYKISVMERINYPLIGTDGYVSLSYGEDMGLYSIEREQQNKEDFGNIFYIFGGTKNLPFGTEGLRLASRMNPIVVQASIDLVGPVEKDVIYEDVYPRGTRTVKQYIHVPGTTYVVSTKNVGGVIITIPKKVVKPDEYMVVDSQIGFDINQLLTKDPAKIVFNSGDLAGYEFVIKSFDYNTGTIHFNPITNEKGQVLPNATLYPNRAGTQDEYIIVNIQPPDIFESEALDELDSLGSVHAQINSVVRNNYRVVVSPKYINSFETLYGFSFDAVAVGNSIKIADADYNIPSTTFRIITMKTDIYSEEANLLLSDLAKYKAAVLLQKMKSSITKMEKVTSTLKMAEIDHKLKSTESVGDFKSEMVNTVDNYLNTEKIRPENIDPIHLALDSGVPQFSIKDAIVEVNVGSAANAVRVNSGSFIHHSYYSIERAGIDKLKSANVEYNPARKWDIALTDITLATNDGYFIYIKIPLAENVSTSEILVDTNDNIYAKRDEGYLIIKIGYIHPVIAALRNISMLWGNILGGGGASPSSGKSVSIRYYGVIPTGVRDGVNRDFVISANIQSNEEVWVNGKQMLRGYEYTVAYGYRAVITFTDPVEADGHIEVDYSLNMAGDRTYSQVPLGQVDGYHSIYTIDADIEENEEVYLNGVLLYKGIGYEITYGSTATITLPYPLVLDGLGGEVLVVNYTPKAKPERQRNKSLTGTVNGVNTQFTLLHSIAHDETIFRNGLRCFRGIDYSIVYGSMAVIQFAVAPESGETITINYTLS